MLVLLGFTAFTARADAANLVYSWNSTGGNWSTAPWSGVGGNAPQTPAPGDTAEVRIFNATSPQAAITTTMDIPGLTIDKLTINGQKVTINSSGGNVLGIRGQDSPSDLTPTVKSLLGENVLALPIAVSGGYVSVEAAGGPLTLAGAVTGPATSTVRLFGAANTGTTVVNGGSFSAGSLGDPGVRVAVESGPLALGNGSTNQAVRGQQLIIDEGLNQAPPIVRLDQPSQIADATDVFVNSAGSLNLNGRSEAVHGLTVNGGGTVDGATSSGFLQVKGSLAMTGGTISGSADPMLELDGDATATSTSGSEAEISGRVALKGARKITVADGPESFDLVLDQSVADAASPGALTKAGAGTLGLLSFGSSYTGGTTVADGTLVTQGTLSSALPAGGTVTVGDGTGAPSSAKLTLGNDGDIASTTALVVGADGRLDLNDFSDAIASLDVQNGTVAVPETSSLLVATAGLIAMNGGTLTGPGTVSTPSVSATGSARIEPRLIQRPGSSNDLEFDVAAGTLDVSGGLDAGGGSGGLVKTGAGALQLSGANALAGATSLQAGTLTMNGTQSTPVTVGAGATLAGTGTVGAATVNGALAPASPALHTGALAFGSTGQLAVTPATHVEVAGTTTIDGGAKLSPALSGNPPSGTALPLIVNDGTDPIAGAFANAAEGTVFAGDASQPFTAGYANGDGNDLSLIAGAVPTPSPFPSPAPSPAPAAKDVRPPAITFTVAKRQKLAKQGTFKVKLACDEACTVTLATTVRRKTQRRTITLRPGKRTSVKVAIPKRARRAVRKTLRAKHSVKVTLSVTARDAAGNVSAATRRRTTLRP